MTYYFQWLQEATRLTIARYPYDCCGPYDRWEYPCRGYVPLLGTPPGATTATWRAGSVATWNVSGIGNHYGGSCQVGFSVDKGENPIRARPQPLTPCSGATFRVSASYEGDCPHRNNGDGPEGQDFQFTVPQDLPIGEPIVFAWIWYNREQELNMNCAAVEITAPVHGYSEQSAANNVPFAQRPEMLVADDGNGCFTPHTTAELKYPQPGPEVFAGDGIYPLELPYGSCGGVGEQAYHGETGNDGHF